MARPAIAMASITLCGSPSRTLRSMKAPGSPSSALQSTYFLSPRAFRQNSHFSPVGNPAPPRPRRPDRLTTSITSSGSSSKRTLASASYPSRAMYSSIRPASMTPQFRSTVFCWRRKNSIRSISGTLWPVAGTLRTSRSTTRPFSRCSSTISTASCGLMPW